MTYWKNKSLLSLEDHPKHAIETLITQAATLKHDKKNKQEAQNLKQKNIALLFEKTSTRTRCAFEVACADQGASSTYIAPGQSQLGDKESIADTARVLSRMYDAIEYRGGEHRIVEELAKYATVPVYNGLTDLSHPTQMLADLLTMQEHSQKPWQEISFAYLGDARYNTGNSLLLAGALMGMNVRIAAPKNYQPSADIIKKAEQLATQSGAKILISEDATKAVEGADFIHTDIWVSMGEDKNVWQERINALMPYRIDQKIMQQANQNAKFMHCLPSYHDRATPIGEDFFQKYQLNGIEVDNSVFESPQSIVFDQAENRLHTIKALLVATLS